MYRVVIVEDEMLVRMGLKNSIQWDKFNMCVIADVANGKLAWEICQKEMPDLIITDIKMPVMDGMELIQKIREKDSEVAILILSCLEEFDLLRKAMSFGVVDYILKIDHDGGRDRNGIKKSPKQITGYKASRKIETDSRYKFRYAKGKIIKRFFIL